MRLIDDAYRADGLLPGAPDPMTAEQRHLGRRPHALRRSGPVCHRIDDVAGDECTQAVRGSPVLADDLTLDHIER